MAYDRYSGNDDRNRTNRYRDEDRGYGRGYSSGSQYSSGGSHDWRGGGRDDDRNYGRQDREVSSGGRDYYGGSRYDSDLYRDDDRGGQGRSSYGRSSYSQHSHDREGRGERGFAGGYNDRGSSQYGRDYGQRQGSAGRDRSDGPYRGSYASDGHRFTQTGDNDYGRHRDRDREHHRDHRPPQGYDHDDRGFLARAGDEVRSWFGDDEAERRREADQRYDERTERYDDRVRGGNDHDYRSWRNQQVSAFDRDYDEYRQENASKFQSEFASWRTERQGQRDSLTRVKEHMEVVGSDGEHVGTVDKVRGDRIILTKNDADAGGHHHSIPSRWVDSVDDKVTLRKTADEAHKAWRDEEEGQAMFGDRSNGASRDSGSNRSATTTGQALGAGTSTTAGTGMTRSDDDGTAAGSTNLNRSFPGTY